MAILNVSPEFLDWWLDVKLHSFKIGEFDEDLRLPRLHWRLNGLSVDEAIQDPEFQAEHPELICKLMTYLVHTS